MLVLAEGGKPEKNPLMALSLGIEPGPHWWEASALITAPALLPYSLIFVAGVFGLPRAAY